jgi:hypothetical protein
MNGILPNPMAVGSQVTTGAGNNHNIGRRFIVDFSYCSTTNRAILTMALIVAPGIKTLANDCQSNVSMVANNATTTAAVVVVLVEMLLWLLLVIAVWYAILPDVTASAKQYPKANIYEGMTNLGN